MARGGTLTCVRLARTDDKEEEMTRGEGKGSEGRGRGDERLVEMGGNGN